MHPSVLHSLIPMTQVQIVRNCEVENSQPIKDVRKCNDFSKVPSGLNIMRLFAFLIFDFLIVSMAIHLEDQGQMSSSMFCLSVWNIPTNLVHMFAFLFLSPVLVPAIRRWRENLHFTCHSQDGNQIKRILAKSSQ